VSAANTVLSDRDRVLFAKRDKKTFCDEWFCDSDEGQSYDFMMDGWIDRYLQISLYFLVIL